MIPETTNRDLPFVLGLRRPEVMRQAGEFGRFIKPYDNKNRLESIRKDPG